MIAITVLSDECEQYVGHMKTRFAIRKLKAEFFAEQFISLKLLSRQSLSGTEVGREDGALLY